MSNTPQHDADQALAYSGPPASPLWHRDGPKARPLMSASIAVTASSWSSRSAPPIPPPAPLRSWRRPADEPPDAPRHKRLCRHHPGPGIRWGTATFDLIHSPADADRIVPDAVFARTTGDSCITDVLLREIQPGDLLCVTGTVVQPDDPEALPRFTVDALELPCQVERVEQRPS